MPMISVITPVYNTENYIRRCVDSILAQTYKDFELILVDDGSPDKCGAICDEYAATDERVYVIHQENQGQSCARNHALDWVFENSSSEWITFVDSDDWVHPQYLEHLLYAVQQTGCRISVCEISKSQEASENARIPFRKCKTIASKDLYLHYASHVFYVGLWGKLFARDLFSSIRLPEKKLWEDLATTYKLLLSVDSCASLDDELYFYFFNAQGTIRSTWRPRRMDEFDAYEEQLEFFAAKPEYREIYETLQGTYIRAISYSYFLERESDLPREEKKHYAAILRNKMRLALRKYGKTAGITFQKNKAVFETAYPGLMQLYWIAQSRIKRLKDGK